MVINVSAAGVIIGKRGFKIKELKEKYTIIITINPYDSIDSSERILYLEGKYLKLFEVIYLKLSNLLHSVKIYIYIYIYTFLFS